MFEPLQGLRILDLSRLIPGAAVTHCFADLGADVIKVETPPIGDYIREVQPQTEGISLQHLTLDRNKRSLALDLGRLEGVAVLHEMIASVDAVVENSRPGAMAKLHADYETLSNLNPRLVYLSFTGYGQRSRYAQLPSHGSNMAAFASINPVVEREDGVITHGPIRYGRYRIPMEEASLHAAFALLAALRESERTRQGRHLDIALVHALIAGDYAAMTDLINNQSLYWQDLPQPTARYAYYRTADDRVLLVCAVELRFWTRFCEIISREDLQSHGRWDSAQMDFADADVDLYREIQASIAQRPLAEWLDLLIPARIPCSPINSMADTLTDPDLGARLFVDKATLPSGREVSLIAPLVQDPDATFTSRPAPSLGRDTEAILVEFGISPELIKSARQSGALA